MRKVFLGIAVGVSLAVAGAASYDAWRYLSTINPPSTTSAEKPFVGFSVAPGWVRSGTPNFRNSETVQSPDGKAISGLWACDGPTTFEWSFYMDETVHLLEGLIEIDYQGQHFTLRPGDTATFHAGTKAVWHVPRNAKKAYTLYQPPKLASLWRKFLASKT